MSHFRWDNIESITGWKKANAIRKGGLKMSERALNLWNVKIKWDNRVIAYFVAAPNSDEARVVASTVWFKTHPGAEISEETVQQQGHWIPNPIYQVWQGVADEIRVWPKAEAREAPY